MVASTLEDRGDTKRDVKGDENDISRGGRSDFCETLIMFLNLCDKTTHDKNCMYWGYTPNELAIGGIVKQTVRSVLAKKELCVEVGSDVSVGSNVSFLHHEVADVILM